MRGTFGLKVVTCIATLVAGDAANAQTVTMTNWNYTASNPKAIPAGRPTINPTGTYSVPPPAAGTFQDWDVRLDYGQLVNKKYTIDTNIGNGIATDFRAFPTLGFKGNYSWNDPGDTLSINSGEIPLNSVARIVLRKKLPDGTMAPQGTAVYLPISPNGRGIDPCPPPGCSPCEDGPAPETDHLDNIPVIYYPSVRAVHPFHAVVIMIFITQLVLQ